MDMDIKKLLKPNRVAVIGASEKEGFGGDTCRNLITYMEKGRYYFINPKRDEVLGVKCYHSIGELPEQVDLIIICTPESTVEGILREGASHGVRAAVVYASGYGEIGTDEGRAKEASLKALCTELGIALMGPNCAGFVNAADKVYPFAFISEKRDRTGSVGIISQSGQLILTMMDSPSVKFSYAISAGNGKIVTPEDYLAFLVEDPDTKVVAMYLEGIKDPRKFTASLKRAAEIRKPIVVLKAGRSEKGKKVAASHTGSMAGSDQVFDALFAKFGVIRVNDLEELLYTAQMFAVLKKLPAGSSFASMNLSGGETGICADVGSLEEIDYPDFAQATLDKLKTMLPSYASPANPLDMTATLSYDTDRYAEALNCVMSDPKVDMVILGFTLLEEIADPGIEYMTPAIERVMAQDGAKPVAMLPFVGNTRNREYSTRLEAAGVVMLPPPIYGFKVLNHLAGFIRYNPSDHILDLSFPSPKSQIERVAHSESASAAIAAKYGLPVMKMGVAKTEAEAVHLASQFGYPVVLKIESADILHKSDIGGVRLNIKNEGELRKAYKEILENAAKLCAGAHINGILVEPMAKLGTEMILGMNNDASFGPAILVGMGGIFVEIFKDTALCLAPVSEAEARAMTASLKTKALLEGRRGKPPLDTEALVKSILAVSNLATAYKDEILEMDFNPVMLYEQGQGLCVTDAVIVANKQLAL